MYNFYVSHTQKDIINLATGFNYNNIHYNYSKCDHLSKFTKPFFSSVLSVEAMGQPIVVSSLGIILVSMNIKEINLYDDYTEK